MGSKLVVLSFMGYDGFTILFIRLIQRVMHKRTNFDFVSWDDTIVNKVQNSEWLAVSAIYSLIYPQYT